MRIATWNIRAGGGRRTEQIARVILEEQPDVLVLTEFRPAPGRALLELLQPLQYHVAAGVPSSAGFQPVSAPLALPARPQNCTCVLSRLPIEALAVKATPKSHHRWVAATISDFDLTILGVHVPNQTEIWNKLDFWDCVEGFAAETVGKRSMIVGDLNTALDEDCEGAPIREAVYLKRLFDAGWLDAWRLCNADAREFSWYSHRQNGFRLDYCLLSPSLADRVLGSSMRHAVRTDCLSDHSLLTVELAPLSPVVCQGRGGRGHRR